MKDDITKAIKNGEITSRQLTADTRKLLIPLNLRNYYTHFTTLVCQYQQLILSIAACREEPSLYHDNKSSNGNVTFGVLQASILGPVLLNLYVSDLSKHTDNIQTFGMQTIQPATLIVK